MDDNYILDKIKRLLEEKGMTYYQLAKISGLSVSSLRNTMRYSYQPTFGTLDKICNGLGITLSQFFAEDDCFRQGGLRTGSPHCAFSMFLLLNLTPTLQHLTNYTLYRKRTAHRYVLL